MAQSSKMSRLSLAPFSRPDLPVHVSFGPDHSRQVVRMVPAAGGRLVPRVVEIARCLEGER